MYNPLIDGLRPPYQPHQPRQPDITWGSTKHALLADEIVMVLRIWRGWTASMAAEASAAVAPLAMAPTLATADYRGTVATATNARSRCGWRR